ISEIKPADDGPMSITATKGSCARPGVRQVPRFSVFIKTDLPPPGCAKIRSNHVVVTLVPVWYGQTRPSGVRNRIAPFSNGLAARCHGTSFIISRKGAAPGGAVELAETP